MKIISRDGESFISSKFVYVQKSGVYAIIDGRNFDDIIKLGQYENKDKAKRVLRKIAYDETVGYKVCDLSEFTP